MDYLKDILVSILSNVIWVVLVFVVLYVKDREKKKQIERCLEAYVIFLMKNVSLLRYNIYPYIYLLELKTMQGNMLGVLLEHIETVCSTILEQSQEILVFVESPKLQEKILSLYHRTIMFHAHIAECISIANIIVGNPTELTEPPRQLEEMRMSHEFVKNFYREAKEIYGLFPPDFQARIPKEIMDMMEQKTPLQEAYEKKVQQGV